MERDRLIPYVHRRCHELATEGADAVVVLCAGAFPDMDCQVPVLIPGRILPGIVRALIPQGRRGRVGIITPVRGQIPAAENKWRADGFDPVVVSASPFNHSEIETAAKVMADPDLELVVLDCMGHSSEYKQEFQRRTGHLVLLTSSTVARLAGELLGR
ncbi:MAG: AroM family protein [Firmicutes bacterium]|nr:AroM family protein [Bacillota bacterium]